MIVVAVCFRKMAVALIQFDFVFLVVRCVNGVPVNGKRKRRGLTLRDLATNISAIG